MESWLQDIRWLRFQLGGPEAGKHPSATMEPETRTGRVLQIKIEGEWSDIPILDEKATKVVDKP
jgi:hypothetical protein